MEFNNTGVCNYVLDLYPSKRFEQAYKSNIAIIAAITVGVAFTIVVFIFIVYDYLVNVRTKKLTSAAERSNAIVSSLFPATVHDRLMEGNSDNDATAKLKGDALAGGTQNFKTIADLYPESTVMFADIVGFTAWSSMREPSQVFLLLETLYSEFDMIARRRRVFKIETIGDCVSITYLGM